MSGLRATTRISGKDPSGRDVLIAGEAVGELNFDPTWSAIAVDASVVPPRVRITVSPALQDQLSELEAIGDQVDDLEETVGDLGDRVSALENPTVTDLPWVANASPDFSDTKALHYSTNPDAVTMTFGAPIGCVDGQEYTIILSGDDGEVNMWDPSYWQLGATVTNAITQTIDPFYSGNGILITKWLYFNSRMYPLAVYNGAF